MRLKPSGEKLDFSDGNVSGVRFVNDMKNGAASRRDVLASGLFGAIPLVLGQMAASSTLASPLNPGQTIITLPGQLGWVSPPGHPERSVDRCDLTGDPNGTGLYYTLVRWWPGYMSAPHTYISDAFCMVLSGTWWCNSGRDFDPAACVPAPAGSFVHRVAGSSHYDGVIRNGTEPAIIAICGVAPVKRTLVDPSRLGWRRV